MLNYLFRLWVFPSNIEDKYTLCEIQYFLHSLNVMSMHLVVSRLQMRKVTRSYRTYSSPEELVANNLAARCVNERGLVMFKVSWQAGGRVGEYRGGRGTNASMTYYVVEHVMVNPLHNGQRQQEEGTKERNSRPWGGHMTRWRCVWTRMSFCAADNLNASNSKTTTLVPEFVVEDLAFGRTAALVPKFAVKDLPLVRNHWWLW